MSEKTGTQETMTLHKALAELKIIGDRVKSGINSTIYVVENRHSNTKLHGVSIADFTKNMQALSQSSDDLTKRRNALKRAVVLSNAVTKVIIGDVEYTVAEAIDMKNSGIELKRLKLDKMRRQYDTAVERCNRENDALASKADNHITGIFNTKDIKNMTEDMIKVRDEFIKQHTMELVETLSVLEEIKALEKEIAVFVTEVDSVLSVSNAITQITINY